MSKQTYAERSQRVLNAVEVILLLSVVVFGYGMLVIGAWHTYPNAEEFELAATPRDIGMLKSILNLMISYDGRYATNFMHAYNPLTFNWICGYKLLPLIAIVGFVASLFFFFRVIINSKNKWHLLYLSLLLSLVWWGCIPSLVCSLYWAGGSFVYLYPCTFALLFIGSLIRYIHQSSTQDKLYFLLSSFTLMIGIGFNEMFLPFYSILLSALMIYYWANNREIFFRILPIALIGFSSILFFVATPAVSVRLGGAEKSLSIQLVANNCKNLFTTFFEAIRKPIVFCLLLYVILLYQLEAIQLKRNVSIKQAIYILIGLITLLYIMAFVYYFPKRELYGYPERIYPPILFVLMVGGFVLPGAIAPHRVKFISNYGSYLRGGLLVIIICSFIWGNNNIAYLFDDFCSLRLQKFKRLMDDRIARLQTAGKTRANYNAILIPKLGEDYPSTIYKYPDDETDRNNSIWNKYHEEYFRLDEITVSGDTSKRFM